MSGTDAPPIHGILPDEILLACQNIMTFGTIIRRHPTNVIAAQVLGIEIGVSEESYYVQEKIDYSLPKTVNGVRVPRTTDDSPKNCRRINLSGGIYWGGWIDFETGTYRAKKRNSISIVNGQITKKEVFIEEPVVRWGKELHRYVDAKITGDIAMFQRQFICLKLLGDDKELWKDMNF